jgi:putative phosphoribosyl transferase
MTRQFKNRWEAGEKLADRLREYKHDSSAIVFAIPRGGVVTGAAAAKLLGLPLKIIVAKKIGHPTSSEYAIGAVTAEGKPVLNQLETRYIDRKWLHNITKLSQQNAREKQAKFPKALTDLRQIKGDTAIIIDDGTATGYTALAAAEAVKKAEWQQIVIAMPVISDEVAKRFEVQFIKVTAVYRERYFQGTVGSYYDDFSQVEDDEVFATLKSIATAAESVQPKPAKS